MGQVTTDNQSHIQFIRASELVVSYVVTAPDSDSEEEPTTTCISGSLHCLQLVNVCIPCMGASMYA